MMQAGIPVCLKAVNQPLRGKAGRWRIQGSQWSRSSCKWCWSEASRQASPCRGGRSFGRPPRPGSAGSCDFFAMEVWLNSAFFGEVEKWLFLETGLGFVKLAASGPEVRWHLGGKRHFGAPPQRWASQAATSVTRSPLTGVRVNQIHELKYVWQVLASVRITPAWQKSIFAFITSDH